MRCRNSVKCLVRKLLRTVNPSFVGFLQLCVVPYDRLCLRRNRAGSSEKLKTEKWLRYQLVV